GKWIGTSIDFPPTWPGALHRATSVAFAGDDTLVVSCDSGQILRYDAKLRECRGTLGTGSKGGLTQAAVRDGRLYVADFHAGGIRMFDLATRKDLGFAVK